MLRVERPRARRIPPRPPPMMAIVNGLVGSVDVILKARNEQKEGKGRDLFVYEHDICTSISIAQNLLILTRSYSFNPIHVIGLSAFGNHCDLTYMNMQMPISTF